MALHPLRDWRENKIPEAAPGAKPPALLLVFYFPAQPEERSHAFFAVARQDHTTAVIIKTAEGKASAVFGCFIFCKSLTSSFW
jgi:hypothetical protein